MKLINVTNSHSRLVRSQLENTDAQVVTVYSAGNTTVVYTQAPEHNEILLINKKRNINQKEVDYVKEYFFKKLDPQTFAENSVSIVELQGLVEISIPKAKLMQQA